MLDIGFVFMQTNDLLENRREMTFKDPKQRETLLEKETALLEMSRAVNLGKNGVRVPDQKWDAWELHNFITCNGDGSTSSKGSDGIPRLRTADCSTFFASAAVFTRECPSREDF